MELGVVTFGDTGLEDDGRQLFTSEQRIKNLIEEAVLADQVGLDVFGVGEHHRPDYAVSAPTTVLAAIAARTEKIRLTSAVTVLSSADPVRVFQEFSTVDLISGGRAEIMAGRGSFTESFPLFGQDLDDYDELFLDSLQLLLEIRKGEKVSWAGSKDRAPIDDRGVYPRPVQSPLPVWIAVGGSPESAMRAGVLGLPLMIAIIGGRPARFKPFVDLYRQAWEQAGHNAADLQFGVNSHVFTSDSPHAKNEYFSYIATSMSRIGRERGWPPLSWDRWEAQTQGDGIPWVGHPEEIAAKILREHELFGNTRFLAQSSIGSMPHDVALKSIEAFGTEVAPLVREEIARRSAS